MTDPRTQVHHLVTRAYQKNFADAQQRVSVLDARTGAVLDASRPIRGNFTSPGFNTAISDDGEPDGTLEQEFCNVERRFADQLRRMRADTPCTEQQRAAICELFALHLVRSPGFRLFSDAVTAEAQRPLVERIAANPEAHARYHAQTGQRDPAALRALADQVFSDEVTSNRYRIGSMASMYNKVVKRLARYHVQLIDTTGLGLGFALADVPVVHADPVGGRYGFRDRLAIGDATVIAGPLTRHLAAALTVAAHDVLHLTTKRRYHEVCALFIRAALGELACHPDDALELRRVCRNIDRIRVESLVA